MKPTMKWELIEDGYYRGQRLVKFPDGLIVGSVRGSSMNHLGWSASTDGPNGGASVGRFVTEDLAKRAVENAQPQEGQS